VKRRIALVTGGGRGIGKYIALALAENGYDVGVNYFRSAEGAREVCGLLEEKGARAISLQADVGKVADIDRMFAVFLAEFGRIDLLVNNAGVTKMAPLLEVTEDFWEQVVRTDWKGAFFCTQRAAADMVSQKTQGVIISITSNQQQGCWPNCSVYGPTKAALMKFTRHAAMELAKYHIRVNAVAPGYTAKSADQPLTGMGQSFISRIPLKRMASPVEIADAVVYLASEKAGYITGTCLTVDGGALLPVVPVNEVV